MASLLRLVAVVAVPDIFVVFSAPEGNLRRLTETPTAKPVNSPCFPKWVFKADGGCSFETLSRVLGEQLQEGECSNTVKQELMKAFNLPSEDDVEEYVNQKCNSFYQSQYTESIPWADITKDGNLVDKEYFDGGGHFNYERQTKEDEDYAFNKYKLQDSDYGQRIKGWHEKMANNNIMQFPDYMSNFENCELRAAMCCFVQDRQANDNNGNCETPYDTNCANADPADNTDICYADMSRSPKSNRVAGGYAIFEEDDEGAAHCHGFAWANNDLGDPSGLFKANNLFYVSMYDHFYQRGYVRGVPGAPMCGCIEQMPVVSRSDCTEIEVTKERIRFMYTNINGLELELLRGFEIEFNSCRGAQNNNNNLEAYYKRLVEEGKAEQNELEHLQQIIVGEDGCNEAIASFKERRRLQQRN